MFNLRASRLFLCLVLLMVWATRPAPAAPTEVRIEPGLQHLLTADETSGYLIYMREKADLSPAYKMNWRDRGRFVAQTLQETAKRTQGRVRAHLDSQGARYQSFWVDNVIVVERSNRTTVQSLLTFNEIDSLRERRKPILYKPVAIESSAFITAIESNLSHIGADQVWGTGVRGEGIVVGNIDTGVRYTHQALVNQYRGNMGGGSFNHNYNWWDPYTNSTSPSDSDDHGSHTMGTMVGDDEAGNQIGMAPRARWIAAQGFTPGATDAGLLSCGQFMTAPTDLTGANPNPDMRPHVVNNSWGDCGRSYDNWYQGVIDAWHAAGVYPVFSNGNASNCGYPEPPGLNTVGNPGRYGNVTGVGATGRSNGAYATYSNWGPTDNLDTINPRGFPNLKPQFVAPGTNRSALRGSDAAYGDMSGTSMAAPHVAGLIALMWSAAPWLVGDYALTETIIETTATPIDYASGGTPPPGPGNIPNYATGWGEINAPLAVQAAMAMGASTLEGHVTAAATSGAPLSDARVEIKGTSITRITYTNSEGYYNQRITTGTYSLTFSKFGYQPQTVNNVNVVDGTTTTLDASLNEAVYHTVMGTVCDSITSWPLYTRIDIEGYPDSPIWTNPMTGAYSVILAEAVDYTFTFSAWVNGYEAQEIHVGTLSGNRTMDVNLAADLLTCTAPGYRITGGLALEGFEEAFFPPTNWITYNIDGGGTVWDHSSTFYGGSYSAFHEYSDAGNQDGWLVTPQIVVPATSATLSFWEYTDYASWYVKHSLWIKTGESSAPPTGWVEVAEFGSPTETWREQTVDLSAYAGQSVYLAFRYEGDDADDWYIDNIILPCEVEIPTGGLIVGNVYNAGSSNPIVGAAVENAGGYTATTQPTPDDDNVDDGFYVFYSPAGATSATARKPYYMPKTQDVTVAGGDTVRLDFSLDAASVFTVSGVVTDAETNWPLYAQIQIFTGGVITTRTWTNPVTGAYSIELPDGVAWEIVASSWVTGYDSRSFQTGLISGDQTLNIPLAPQAGAPGYSIANPILEESFETPAFPPAGWSAYDIDGGNTAWTRTGNISHDGLYAATHQYSDSALQDGWLITPQVSVPNEDPVLSFWEFSDMSSWYFKHSLWVTTGSLAAPPTGWVEVTEFGDATAAWRRQSVDLSAYAGQSIHLAFRYEGYDADDWYIDSVVIGTLMVPSGGLVVGNVYDASDTPLVGAVVANPAAYTAITGATTSDGNVDDGFYVLYSPAGATNATATMPRYKPQTQSLNVSAGDAILQNFHLADAQSYTIAGTVYDSLTSWPLYARIDFSATGMPTTTTWTTPFSGAYSVDLLEGVNWTLQVSSWVSGYEAANVDTGLLAGDRNVDITMTPTATAPGYGIDALIDEGFEDTTFPPTGWTAYNVDAGGTEWVRSTALFHSGAASAWHQYSSAGDQDGWLVTPQVTIPAKGAALWFWESTQFSADYEKQSLWITSGTLSTPPTGWKEVVEFDNPTATWRLQKVDLSAYAGHDIYLAFRYQGNDASGWFIDDVLLGNLTVPSGGLLGGFVSDANTGNALTGATVRIEGGRETQTGATPDDTATDDGLYFLYAPAGTWQTTATMSKYAPDTENVTLLSGQITRQDYALPVGRLGVAPGSLQVYVTPGDATTRTLILSNTGTASIDFTIRETALGFTTETATAPKSSPVAAPTIAVRRPGRFAETGVVGSAPKDAKPSGGPAPADIGTAWETMAPIPAGRVFAAVVADANGYIYVIGGNSDAGGSVETDTNYRYDTATDTWTTMAPLPAYLSSIDAIAINNSIYVPGDAATATTYVYDIAANTWASIATNNGYTARSQYQVVAIGADLYVLGGIVAAASASTTEVWILDTETGTWSAGAPMQKSRTSFSAAVIADNIYVAGGVLFPGFTPDMTAEKFDGASWSYIANVPNGGGAYTRWSYNADAVGTNGMWLAAGRRDAGWAVLNHAAYYDPQADSWTDSPTIPMLAQGRVYMEGDVASDGYLYVIGGRDSAGSSVYTNNERLLVGYTGFSDAPWLSLDLTSGTIGAGESISIVVTMDSSVPEATAPGTYRAGLKIQTNSPYATPDVPVTMIVSEQGALQVNIEPPAAVATGAMWRLLGENDEDWAADGDTRNNIPVGTRTVEFKSIPAWVAPANQTVLVTTDSLAVTTGAYVRMTYTLTYLAGSNGWIDGATSQTVEHGDSGSQVVATANSGYRFSQWSDGVMTAARTDNNVTANLTVTATFSVNPPGYTLTYIAGPNGTIDGLSSRTMVVYLGDDGTTVTAIPNPGYKFLRWSDDLTTNPRIDTSVTSSILVTALFGEPDSGFSAAQVCIIQSDNRVFAGMFNYALGGSWAAWLDAEGGGSLNYDLPAEEWLGFFLYDYAAGTWTEGMYVYKN